MMMMRFLLPAALSAHVAALAISPSDAITRPFSLSIKDLSCPLPNNDLSNPYRNTPNGHFPDPWVTQSPGHISCWEFYGLHSHLPQHPALQAWRQAYTEAETKLRAGQADQRMGTQTRHWVGHDEQSGVTVDVVLIPREEMTWRMVWEVWRAVKALICLDGREFQFLVMTQGVQGEVGLGDTKVRREGVDGGRRGRVEGRSEKVGVRLPPAEVVEFAGVNSTAITAVTDPFVWQHSGMVSAWLFFGFSGHLDYNAAAMAAHRAYDEAVSRHPPDSLIGAGTRTWTGVYRDAEPVDFVLIARPIMTWRMLAEGITGAQMVVYEGKEFRFSVSLDGVGLAAGYGWMMRRGSTPGNIAGSRNDTKSNVPWPTDLAATLTAVAEVKVNASRVDVTAFRDPYVRHDAGMITTWEYYGYRGSLNAVACQTAWLELNLDVSRRMNRGQIDVPIGRQSMHWPVRSGDVWVDLVVNPGPQMTWRMLGEGVVGGVVVCSNVAKDYQFGIFIQGVEGSLGVGQITTRNHGASTS